MSPNAVAALVLLLPLLVGGAIAALNSPRANDATESAEAWVRRKQELVAAHQGWVSKLVLSPLLWAVVRFCDRTDAFAHRGLKNGTRVAATLYLFGLWLYLLWVAVIVAMVLVVLAIAIYIAAKIMVSSSGGAEVDYSRLSARRRASDALALAGLRGKKVYSGTSWLNEEIEGRVDDEGNLYRGKSWLTEEKIGRIDDDGNIYRGRSSLSEVKVGRIDQDGTLYKGPGWFSEEKVGRLDVDGSIYEGKSSLSEEKRGRTGD